MVLILAFQTFFFNFIWIMDADQTFQYLLFSLPPSGKG